MKFKFFGGKFSGQYIDVPTDEARVPPSLFTIGCQETPGIAHRYYAVRVGISYGKGVNGFIFASSEYQSAADILDAIIAGAKPAAEEF